MTIEDSDVVDFVLIDKASGEVTLSISDHLPWDSGEGRHLELLQCKLNAYLRFIESGELLESCPKAIGRNVVINLVGKDPLGSQAKIFFAKAVTAVSDAGYQLQFQLYSENQ